MKPIVLLAGPGESTNIVYHHLAAALPVARVVIERPMSRAEFLRRRARRLGWPTVLGQVAFQAGVVPWLRRRYRARIEAIRAQHAMEARPIDESVVTRVESANAPETAALLRSLAPSVIVVNGTRILSKALLSSVDAPFVNTHAGITPLYRGVHGGYWAQVDGGPCGVTVHLVNEGIDTGGILAQATISPTAEDSFVTYPELQLAAALPLLVASVKRVASGDRRTLPPPPGESRLFSHPTIVEYVKHRALRGVR